MDVVSLSSSTFVCEEAKHVTGHGSDSKINHGNEDASAQKLDCKKGGKEIRYRRLAFKEDT